MTLTPHVHVASRVSSPSVTVAVSAVAVAGRLLLHTGVADLQHGNMSAAVSSCQLLVVAVSCCH